MSKQNKRVSSVGFVRHAGLRSWLIMGLVLALVVTLAAGAQVLQPAAAPLPPRAPLAEQDTAPRLQDSQNVSLLGRSGAPAMLSPSVATWPTWASGLVW